MKTFVILHEATYQAASNSGWVERFSVIGELSRDDFNAVALGVFAALEPTKRLRVLGDKMPMTGDWNDVEQLVARLPDLRILVVVRNPADVVASSLIRRAATMRGRDNWPIGGIHEAIVQCMDAWHSTLRIKAKLADAVLIVKYEDVCLEPARVMAEIDAFLGLPPHLPDARIVVRPPDVTLLEPRETQALGRHLGAVIQAWPSWSAKELMQTFAALPLPYRPSTKIMFADEQNGTCRLSGLSMPTPQGRWMEGACASIELVHGETTGVLLIELWVAEASVDADGRCDVVLRAALSAPRLFTIAAGGGRAAFAVRAGDAKEKGTLTLDMTLAKPNPSSDRTSGICLQALRVTHLERGAARPLASPGTVGDEKCRR